MRLSSSYTLTRQVLHRARCRNRGVEPAYKDKNPSRRMRRSANGHTDSLPTANW